jgi:hypothetical protein
VEEQSRAAGCLSYHIPGAAKVKYSLPIAGEYRLLWILADDTRAQELARFQG